MEDWGLREAALPLRLERDLNKALTGVFVFILVIYIALRHWWFRVKYDWHRIPSPRSYPLVGHWPHYLSWDKPRVPQMVLRWAKVYGRIFKTEALGLPKCLYLFDPECLQQQVTGHGKHGMPRHAPTYDFFRKYTGYRGDNLLTAPHVTNHFRAVRKALAPAFSTENLKTVFPTVLKKALELTQFIERADSNNGIDFQAVMPRCTLDIVALAGFGFDCQSLKSDESPFLEALQCCDEHVIADMFNPLRDFTRRYLPFTKHAKQTNHDFSTWYSEVEKQLKRATPKSKISSDDKSIWGCLNHIRDPDTGEPLDTEALRSECILFLVAGTSTTAQTLALALLCLAAHPESQDRIREDMQEKGLFPTKENNSDRPMRYEDVMSLQYLTMVIKETVRMFPVGGGTAREVAEDGQVICGYRVPKGVLILNLHYPMHHLPFLWDEPDVFRPERFSKETNRHQEKVGWMGSSVTHRAKTARKFWAFSDGPRDCIGQRLAMMSMHAILAVLLSKYRFRLADRMGDWDESLSRLYMSIGLVIDGGIWVHCDPL